MCAAGHRLHLFENQAVAALLAATSNAGQFQFIYPWHFDDEAEALEANIGPAKIPDLGSVGKEATHSHPAPFLADAAANEACRGSRQPEALDFSAADGVGDRRTQLHTG